MRSAKSILNQRPMYWLLAAVTLQQLIVASSNFWLVGAANSLGSPQKIMPWVAAYLASLVLPYAPGTWALIELNHWKLSTLQAWIDGFLDSHGCHPTHWNDRPAREDKTALLSQQGPDALNEVIDCIYDFAACLLNVLLNWAALAYLLSPLFVIAYSASLVIAAIFLRAQKKKRESLASEVQSTRLDVTTNLISAWDNVVLGNQRNLDVWSAKLRASLDTHSSSSSRKNAYHQISASAMGVLILLPTIGLAGIQFYSNSTQPQALNALLVSLPRMFMLLGFTHHLLSLFSLAPFHLENLRRLKLALNSPEKISLENRIQASKIQITQSDRNSSESRILSISEFDRDIATDASNAPGRWTIRAENGAGKSSYLLTLKEKLKTRAILVPTRSGLCFLTTSETSRSSGQEISAVLQEISDSPLPEYLLLDEWDAHLDSAHRKKLNELLDQLATRCRVIEIRH